MYYEQSTLSRILNAEYTRDDFVVAPCDAFNGIDDYHHPEEMLNCRKSGETRIVIHNWLRYHWNLEIKRDWRNPYADVVLSALPVKPIYGIDYTENNESIIEILDVVDLRFNKSNSKLSVFKSSE